MALYNPPDSLKPDDTDVTIINHSFLYGINDEPISTCIPVLRRVQQASQSPNNTQPIPSKSINDRYNRINSGNPQDYMFVDHNSLETTKQIEQILYFYRQELKQESNTQLDCNKKLITRLVDLVRPIYSSNQKEMNDLDTLYEEIFNLHDKRFIEQKEKNEQLHNEIRHLKKSIIQIPIEDDNRNSIMTNLYRLNSMVHYEQWVEMEEETKKLHNLVKTQHEQIDKLIEILSQTEIVNYEKHDTPTKSISLSNHSRKKCSLCNYEFPLTYSDDQISKHVERCLSTSGLNDLNISIDSNQLECPYCYLKLSNNDDIVYLQHLAQCYDRVTDNSSVKTK